MRNIGHGAIVACAFAALAALTAGGPADAADMPVKAPVYKVPLVAPVFSWTGCYLGGNVGYGWNTGGSTYNDPNNPITDADPINGGNGFSGGTATVPTPSNTSGKGWLGGGGAGCNLQSSQFVLGIEADIDAMGISGSSNTVGPHDFYKVCPIANIGCGAPPRQDGSASEQVSLRWLSTVRVRGGVTIDRLLLFATGGLAVGATSTTGLVNIGPGGGASAIWSGASASTKAGYVVGGGAEYAFTDQWMVKGEYLYFNLGSVSHPLNISGGGAATFAYPSLGNTTATIHGSIVRVGLNYKLDWGGPVVARY